MALTEATIATLAAGGMSAGGSIVGDVLSYLDSKKQREWSEQMFQRQNDVNVQNWKMQNEYNEAYNDPSSKVGRMVAAGLNPAAFDLDGNSTAAISSAASPAPYSLPNYENPVTSGLQGAIAAAQLDKLQAEISKINNENLTETQRREKLTADIDKVRQEIKNDIANENYTNAQRESLHKADSWLDRINQAAIEKSQSDIDLNRAQTKRINELIEGEKLIQSKTIEDFERKWAKISAEIKSILNNSELTQLDIDNYLINHLNNGILGSGISIPNIIRGIAAGVKAMEPDENSGHLYSVGGPHK